MALRVLAHFVPGDRVLEFVAPESDWLDIRWCAEADDTEFQRQLPHADVIWYVLRPLPGDDLRRGTRLRLVQKLGAGVNTIDVATATERGIAVANMPGANAPSVAEGAVLLMSPASGRCRQAPAPAAGAGPRGSPRERLAGGPGAGRDIGGCTVGLVGYGNIAKRVREIVAAMGATPIICSAARHWTG